MNKAVLYARVSSKDQEREGFSLPAQRKLLQEYAIKRDLMIVKEFVEAETAKRAGRKQFELMIEYLKAHPECRDVLVEKTDRLYRNFHDYIALDIDLMNLRVHQVKEGTVLSKESKSHQKFMHGVGVLMAKQYIDNLSEEVKKGQAEKLSQGGWPGAAPLGYLNKLDDHTIAIDPDVGPIIARAFQLAATGQYSLNRLRRELYQGGLRSRRAKTMLGKEAIAHILKNPIYHGVISWGGTLHLGKHEPLIGKQLYDQAQIAMGFVQKPRLTKHNHAFAGLLTCGHCGCAVTAEQKRKKSGRIYVYYHCTNGKDRCENVVYPREEAIEDAFSTAMRLIHVGPEIVEWTRTALLESFETERTFHDTALKSLNARHLRLQSNIDKSYVDKLEGAIELELWERYTAQWKAEQLGIATQLRAHEKANTAYLIEGVKLMELANRAHELFKAGTTAEKRELVGLVLSNPQVRDGSVGYSYKMPFAMLTNVTEIEKWRERWDSNPRPSP